MATKMSKAYVAKLNDAFEYKDWGGCIKFLLMPPDAPVRNATLEIGIFKPGEDLKPHSHSESEEIYYVIKGKGHLRVGTEELDLVEGMAVIIPLGQEHYLKNNGNDTLQVAFITSPPEKWWLLERLEKLESEVRRLTSKT
jgi:mannose-6-phosphate isomerase-like protein (cupin superfamily)